MKVKKVLCLMLSLVLAFGLSLTTLAAGEGSTATGFYADPAKADQKWDILTVKEEGTDADIKELKVEAYKKGIKVSAVPTAKGDPWKFVKFYVEVDLDDLSVLNVNVENVTNGMEADIKVTRDENDTPANDYLILSERITVAGNHKIDLKEKAKTAKADPKDEQAVPDTNKTGEGKEKFWVKIAFFPSGTSGAWGGEMLISEISIPGTPVTVPTDKPETKPTTPQAKPWYADLKDAGQAWKVLEVENTAGKTVPELNLEAYKKGIKVSAVPTAKGDPWKFVSFFVEVDLDECPLFNFNIESAKDMGVEIKVTRDENDTPLNDYLIFTDRISTAGNYQVNLQDAAKTAKADPKDEKAVPDTNKTGEGKEKFWIKIAFFPSGEPGAWSGDMAISELSVTGKDGGNGGIKPPSAGQTLPVAATAVTTFALIVIISLVITSKRKRDDTL